MIRFSRTVSSLSSVSSCGTTPRRDLMRGPSLAGSRPSTLSVPPVIGDTQPIIRIVELWPAPFGPRKPNASPRRTSKSIPSTARSVPNSLTRLRARISASPAPTVRGYLQALERLGEVLELVLVGEDELDAAGADLCMEPGQTLERLPHTRGERGIDRSRSHARTLSRARPFRALLRGPYREPLLHDLARQPAATLVVGDGENRTRMTLAQLTALDHAEHVVGEVEQADPVRDRGLRPADALRDVTEREPELVDQHRVCTCFLHRRELLTRDVLDQAEEKRVAVVRLAHDGWHRRPARLTRSAPAPLAGDDLVATCRARAHEQRLDHTL